MSDVPLPESDIAGDNADDDAGLQEVHERALSRFDTVAAPQQEMRAQALEARRFVTIPGAMWEGAWGQQFENVPRPEDDKVTKSLEKIETDYRDNRITAAFKPVDQQADEDTAETLDGMHRADSYHFKAQQARDNAFQEAIRGGFGAYRLTTDYADPYDPDSDAQRINPGMVIVDADQSVYFDGGSKIYDKSDAKWAFIIVAQPRSDAIAEWGDDSIAPWPVQQWKYAYDWYQPDIVKIAEYYEVEDCADRLVILSNKLTGEEQRYFTSEVPAKEIADLVAQGWDKRTRTIRRKRVHKYILNGTKVLRDCGCIAGDNIPVVPVYGRRDWVDNMERFRGHVSKRMDAQRIYNTRIAKLVELDSLSPREVPIFAPEQIDEVQADQWARANIDRLPYLTAHALRHADGTIAQVGPIGKLDPPQLQPVTASLLQIAASSLADQDDNADQVKSNVSADAMDIAADRVDAKSAIYLDNMRQSVQREAEIYLSMAREVYYEPGRKVDTLSQDGEDGTAELSEAHLNENNLYRIRNDLSKGRYKVVADVQESTATKRQKTVRQSVSVAEIAAQAQAMDLAQAALLTAVMNMDGEGIENLQEFARNKGIGIGLVKPTPEEQQQISQAQQGQQPSAGDQALLAQASKLGADAQAASAEAVRRLADAHLKNAQAEALGGPDKAPAVPTGLSAPEVADKLAGASLKSAQADHLRQQMELSPLRAAHEMHIAERAQSLAEQKPKEPKA